MEEFHGVTLIKRSVTVCSVSCMDNPVCIVLFAQYICGGEGLCVSREVLVPVVELGLNKGCVPEIRSGAFAFHFTLNPATCRQQVAFIYYIQILYQFKHC